MSSPFERALDKHLAHMKSVMMRKQADYGPGNVSAFGDFGVLVRASDKLERLRNLYQSGAEPNNESVADSWLDLANYGLIAQMWLAGDWGLSIEDDTSEEVADLIPGRE